MADAGDNDPREKAFRLAKLQAVVDGFDDELLRLWFMAAWELCESMTGYVGEPEFIDEPIVVRRDGSFMLSRRPSSEVEIYNGAELVMTLPRSLERSRCDPALCCFCWLHAQYWTGEDRCALPARFVAAVCRLFAYQVENRGDADLDEHVLKKSGAFAFLASDLTYAL